MIYNTLYIKKGGESLVIYSGFVSQVLWSGGYMDAVDGTLHISDQELASMRKLEVLEVLCEDVLPRSLSEIQRLSAQLEQRRGSLRMDDFERTVLTMVFTAQHLPHTSPGHQRELWVNALLRLYKAVKGDLRPADEWLTLRGASHFTSVHCSASEPGRGVQDCQLTGNVLARFLPPVAFIQSDLVFNKIIKTLAHYIFVAHGRKYSESSFRNVCKMIKWNIPLIFSLIFT